jgi:hypothetical protein
MENKVLGGKEQLKKKEDQEFDEWFDEWYYFHEIDLDALNDILKDENNE